MHLRQYSCIMKPSIVPPPWKLTGRGYIFVYKFSKDFIKNFSFLSSEEINQFKGSFGSVMIVQYKSSDAGPYDELLFIPGQIEYYKNKRYTISKIYVSTQISVDSGRENWGIPKELADFHFDMPNHYKEIIRIEKNHKIFFEVEVSRQKLKFPITTTIFPLMLHQFYQNKLFITKFRGKGMATFAKIENINVISDFFPPVKKPLLGLYVDPFELEFPVPEIIAS